MRNCLCVFGLRLTMKIKDIFVGIFISLYLWSLSGGSISILCQYHIVFVLYLYGTMLTVAPLFSKHRFRKIVMVVGCVLQLVYLLMIYRMGQDCVNNVLVLAAVNGIANGMYYCIYNLYEAEGIDNDARIKVTGRYDVINAIVSVAFPILAGLVIDKYGMRSGIVSVAVISVLAIILAALYKDNGQSIGTKFSFSKMFEILSIIPKGKAKYMTAMSCDLFRGFINSYGSFDIFISVWTMIAFSTATQVGSVSGISTCFKIIFGLVFSKFGLKLHKKNITMFYVLRGIVVASLISMAVTGNVIGLIVMTVSLKCSEAVESPIYGCGLSTLSNSGELTKYKSEFYVSLETILTIARLTGYSMLWVWGRNNTTITLAMCIIVYSITLIITPAVEDRLYRFAYNIE